jgi:TolA-binding protein
VNARSTRIEEGVKAFRELTVQPVDGQATRARVLIAAAVAQHRRRRLRRILPIFGLAGVVLGSAAGAITLGHHPWSSAEPAGMRPDTPTVPEERSAPAALEPLRAPNGTSEDVTVVEEYALYARAHEAHFRGRDAQAALVAWEDYLRHHPRGAFAPEAHFNRAICFLRLKRSEAAAAELRRFAGGKFGRYRRAEACVLLRRLGEPTPAGCGSP